MSRKLYAIFILIWAIWAFVLAYLYFFVYYTATLTIDANVEDYRVELFSLGTAQKWTHDCPEKECIISWVSPFDYNISIIKTDYVTKLIPAKIWARWKESIVVELEKKVSLISLEQELNQETNKEKIQRLREENLYYARFQIDTNTVLNFIQDEQQMLLQYRNEDLTRDIGNFKLVKKDAINIDSIPETGNIFLSLGTDYYIFDTQKLALTKLPFTLEVNYIKGGISEWMYHVVTPKGTFSYNISDNTSKFEYLFKDFLYSWDDIIWIIYSDEDEKKSNFNISKSGNLIIKYSPADKTRKIVETTTLSVDRLEWRGDKIIFSAGDDEYELTNFD